MEILELAVRIAMPVMAVVLFVRPQGLFAARG